MEAELASRRTEVAELRLQIVALEQQLRARNSAISALKSRLAEAKKKKIRVRVRTLSGIPRSLCPLVAAAFAAAVAGPGRWAAYALLPCPGLARPPKGGEPRNGLARPLPAWTNWGVMVLRWMCQSTENVVSRILCSIEQERS